PPNVKPAVDCWTPWGDVPTPRSPPKPRDAARSVLSLFVRDGSGWNPLEGDGLFLLGVGDGGGLRRRSRLRFVATGYGHVLGTLWTRDDKPGASLIDHHVLSARSTKKVDVDRSSSGTSFCHQP